MTTEEIKNMVDLYIDGELGKEEEPLLFTMLSLDKEARDYFKGANYLTNNIQMNLKQLPPDLDEKILHLAGSTSGGQSVIISRRLFNYISYAIIILCVAASVFFYSQSRGFKEQLFNTNVELKRQNEDLKLIINTMSFEKEKEHHYFMKPVITKAGL